MLLARAVAAALLLLPSLLFGQGGADGARLHEAGRAAGERYALSCAQQHPPAQAEAPPGRPAP